MQDERARQGDLFSGPALRDDGMAKAEQRDPEWNELAYAAIISIAQRQRELHTDDLIGFCRQYPPPSKYAMGPVWMNAIRAGVIADTGRVRRATDPKKHAHKMAIYQSLIWRGIR
jgi:hypothetical protein